MEHLLQRLNGVDVPKYIGDPTIQHTNMVCYEVNEKRSDTIHHVCLRRILNINGFEGQVGPRDESGGKQEKAC